MSADVGASSRAGPFANRQFSAGSERTSPIVFGILGLAAVLRFATLGLQSYWSDEAVTVNLVRGSLRHMLSAIPNSERTPPVYYVLAWIWSRLFGTSEVGLRSLSAIFGTLTVLLAYVIARRVGGERAGLIAASLTAVSPILVWYSQEARSYSMLVLLCAASVWLWLRALETGSTRSIIAWGAVACLAIATHYFASFIVVFEAVSLLRQHSRKRVLWSALAIIGVVQVALIPLAIHQSRVHEAGDYITATSLSSRIIAIPKRFLLGEHGAPGATALFACALVALLGITSWLFVSRVSPEARSRALPLLLLAALATGLPLALAVVGLDFLAYRNLLAVWVLLAVVAAVALSTRGSRLPAVATWGLALVSLTLTVAVNLTPSLQRADWRFARKALGRPAWARVIVVTPNFEADPFRIYVPSARFLDGRRIVVREVDLVGYRIPPGRHPPRVGMGFRLEDVVDHQKLSFVRYVAPRPIAIGVRRVHGLTHESRTFLLQAGLKP
jgi:mannosyltransferase